MIFSPPPHTHTLFRSTPASDQTHSSLQIRWGTSLLLHERVWRSDFYFSWSEFNFCEITRSDMNEPTNQRTHVMTKLLKYRRLSRICFHGRLTASRNFHGRRPAYTNRGRRGRLSRRLRGLLLITTQSSSSLQRHLFNTIVDYFRSLFISNVFQTVAHCDFTSKLDSFLVTTPPQNNDSQVNTSQM